MKLNFIKSSPAQNMTAFITDYVSPSTYVPIANQLMEYEYLHVEQVGFIVEPKESKSVIRLAMSGGEFCGNGLLSAAAYCVHKGLSNESEFLVEISGSDYPLKCQVKEKSTNVFETRGEMPQPSDTKDIIINVDGNEVPGSIVKLDGITHFVTAFWPTKEDYPKILEALTSKVADKAIGIIPYKKQEEAEYEIAPFVYVTETGSMIFERACGSGTLALGVHLAKETNEKGFNIHQPGGLIKVEIGERNSISTDVRFISEGIVHLDL